MSRPECTCTAYSEDMGGGYYATMLEPDPDCPEHFPETEAP